MGIQHLPVIIGLRRGAVNTGKWENDYGGKLFLNLERNGNALGFAATERQKFIEKNAFPIYDGTQEYCLWLGCMGAYDPQGARTSSPSLPKSSATCVTFGVLRKEKCTATPRAGSATILFTHSPNKTFTNITGQQSREDAQHLPPLRSHHEQGLGRSRGVTVGD